MHTRQHGGGQADANAHIASGKVSPPSTLLTRNTYINGLNSCCQACITSPQLHTPGFLLDSEHRKRNSHLYHPSARRWPMSPITILLTQPSGDTFALPPPNTTSYKRMTPVLQPSPDASLLHAPQVLMVRTPRSRPKRRESLPAHVPRTDEERGRTPRTPDTPRVPRVSRSPRSFDLAGTEDSGAKLTPPPLPPQPRPNAEPKTSAYVLDLVLDNLKATHEASLAREGAEKRAAENHEPAKRERPRGRQRPSAVDAGTPALATVVECARDAAGAGDAPYAPTPATPIPVIGPRHSAYSGCSGTGSRSKL